MLLHWFCFWRNILTAVAVHSRTCASLPLADDPDRPRIDFTVLLVSMCNKKSVAFARDAIDRHFDVDAVASGRACIVASHSESPGNYAVDPKALQQLASDIDAECFMCDLTVC